MHNMFRAIRRIVEEYSNIRVIYPIHMNPAVRQIASEELGNCEDNIYSSFKVLIDNEEEYKKMSQAKNPYGDGYASVRIADVLERGVIQ